MSNPDIPVPSSSQAPSAAGRASSSQMGGLPPALSEAQHKALQHLAGGSSISAAAKAIGVCRSTVHRWLRSDPPFRAAYNAWRQEVLESAQMRLLVISEDAVSTIHDAIGKGDVTTAMELIRCLGLLRRPRLGPTDTKLVARHITIEEFREEAKIERLEQAALENGAAAKPGR